MPSKPRDRRDYVRLSVALPSHPKLGRIDDPNASWLFVVGICWSGEHLTDGHLQPRLVERLAGVARKWTAALVTAGLWHEAGHTCPECPQPAVGDVVIHDYLQHQRSREEVDSARTAATIAAGKRWAGRDAKGMPSASEPHSGGHSEPDADSNAEVEVEEEKFKTNPPHPSGGAPQPSQLRGTRLPEDFEPTPALLAWVRADCPDVPASEHARFVDYWRSVAGAKGRKLDWPATWRNWMRRAQDDIRSGRRPGAGPRPSTTDQRVAAGLALAAQYDAEDGTAPSGLATVHQLQIGTGS